MKLITYQGQELRTWIYDPWVLAAIPPETKSLISTLKYLVCSVLLREYQETNPTATYSYLYWLCFCVCFWEMGAEESLQRRKECSLPREQHIRHRCSDVQDGRRKLPLCFCCNTNLAWKPRPACKAPLSCWRLAVKASWCYISDSSASSISCLASLLQLRVCTREVSTRPGETDPAGVDAWLLGSYIPNFQFTQRHHLPKWAHPLCSPPTMLGNDQKTCLLCASPGSVISSGPKTYSIMLGSRPQAQILRPYRNYLPLNTLTQGGTRVLSAT